MRIVIVGAGKVGDYLCNALTKEGNDIVLIEKNPKTLEKVVAFNDIMGIVGSGGNYDVQVEANVGQADVFVAVTASDEINIISAVIARKLGAKYTIVRVRNPEYSSHVEFMSDGLDIQRVINPELEAAKEISRNIEYPKALKVDSFGKGKALMIEVLLEENSPLTDITLAQFRKNFGKRIIVCIVQRKDKVIIPKGDFVLKEGDIVSVMGSLGDLKDFYKNSEGEIKKIKSVIIIGGGRIAHYLTGILLKQKIEVKIIELDTVKARELADAYPEAMVIQGDGTDLEVLEAERFRNYEACVSLTGIDEENIIISMFAKRVGIQKSITKVSRVSILDMLGLMALDTTVTPKKIVANHIIRIVRGISNSQGSNVEQLYRLVNNEVEALEFIIKNESDITNIPIKDLKLKENLLIVAIIRGQDLIFPDGNSILTKDDAVIVVTTQKYLRDISDILE